MENIELKGAAGFSTEIVNNSCITICISDDTSPTFKGKNQLQKKQK